MFIALSTFFPIVQGYECLAEPFDRDFDGKVLLGVMRGWMLLGTKRLLGGGGPMEKKGVR